MWYKDIAGRFFGLVTKHACDRRTDRRTDGQNYDSQDRASIAASRGKNRYTWLPLLCLTPPAEGFPWDDLREIFSECQRMAKVPNAVEILPKI